MIGSCRPTGCAVETEKGEAERDKYQRPELYGQPKKKGMNNDVRGERIRNNGNEAQP